MTTMFERNETDSYGNFLGEVFLQTFIQKG